MKKKKENVENWHFLFSLHKRLCFSRESNINRNLLSKPSLQVPPDEVNEHPYEYIRPQKPNSKEQNPSLLFTILWIWIASYYDKKTNQKVTQNHNDYICHITSPYFPFISSMVPRMPNATDTFSNGQCTKSVTI